jgi:putative ABC transport system permease protein
MKPQPTKPPVLAAWLLDRSAQTVEKETIVGDMEEYYADLQHRAGRFNADVWFWRQVLLSLPVLITHSFYWSLVMFKNYLKVAARNLRNHPGYTFINISGLAVGASVCLLMLVYIQHELSYDRFHDKADRIYRVIHHTTASDMERASVRTPFPWGPAIKEDLPEVEEMVRLVKVNRVVRFENKMFKERFLYADSTFFDVFGYRLVAGDPKTALQAPKSLVMTESLARKYFGMAEAVGQTLTITGKWLKPERSEEYQVTGVLADPSQNGHFHPEFLGSISSLAGNRLNSWTANSAYTYLVLTKGQSQSKLEKKIAAFLEPHFRAESLQRTSLRPELQPLTKIHLHSNLDLEIEPGGSIVYVYLFLAIAFFILLIACINFMNLATARAAERAKEVGLRKVLGAHRKQLMRQFLSESLLLSLFAMGLGVLLAELGRPILSTLSGKQIVVDYGANWVLLFGLLATGLVVGLISGSYPAFVLSSFQPVKVLKGRFASSSSGTLSRKTLITFQFTISMVLIAATIMIHKQLTFVQNKPLGFQKEQILSAIILFDRPQVVKAELEHHPNIERVTTTSARMGERTGELTYQFEGVEGRLSLHSYSVDHDFFDTFGIESLQGRVFSEGFSTDSSSFVLNETAVRKLGWAEPLGKQVELWRPTNGNEYRMVKKGSVIGVVKDFHYQSLHEEIQPLVMLLYDHYWYFSIKVRTEGMRETLAFLQETWKKFAPELVFEYTFLDEDYAAFYSSEQRIGQIFSYAAGLAILIACLGLFGLASYMTVQRTKEIGVRKVLGASASGLILLLFKDVGKLVGLAFLIAVPLSYFGLDRWLTRFAYHVDLGPTTFLSAGVLSLLIAILTVSYHSLRAAMTNPVKSLRYE